MGVGFGDPEHHQVCLSCPKYNRVALMVYGTVEPISLRPCFELPDGRDSLRRVPGPLSTIWEAPPKFPIRELGLYESAYFEAEEIA